MKCIYYPITMEYCKVPLHRSWQLSQCEACGFTNSYRPT